MVSQTPCYMITGGCSIEHRNLAQRRSNSCEGAIRFDFDSATHDGSLPCMMEAILSDLFYTFYIHDNFATQPSDQKICVSISMLFKTQDASFISRNISGTIPKNSIGDTEKL